MEKIPHRGHFPSAARFLIEDDICSTPRQYNRDLAWAEGIDIVYTLRNLTPANFLEYSDKLLLLALQEATRYNQYKWKFAGFDVKLGRLKKGRDLPEIATFQSAMHDEPDIMVYGPGYEPGYEPPQRHFLYNKVEDILDIVKRYTDKVNKQSPYKVIRLFISIREPRE